MVDGTTGAKEYFHANHQGSIIAMTGDSGGRVEGPFKYDPYGNCFAGSNPCTTGEPYRFETAARDMILAGDLQPLIDYETLGQDAALCIPTPEHYLPLLYVLGAGRQGERIRFPVEGVDGGSISMLAVQIG